MSELEPIETSESESNVLLPPPARVALQRLLAKGVVLARNADADYQLISAHRDTIKHVLATMGLRLVVSEGYRMAALLRPDDMEKDTQIEDDSETQSDGDLDLEIEGEDEEVGLTLIRTQRLTVLNSVVLMELRQRFRTREQAGDQIVTVDLDDLKDRLRAYWTLLNVSGTRADKQFSGAVRKMERHCILLPLRGQKNQREISPVITLAMGPEQLNALVDEYRRLLKEPRLDSVEA